MPVPKSRIQLTPKHFIPTDFVHGMGNGRTGIGSRPLRSRDPIPGKRSRAPPYNPLGGRLLFLLGRNGHDGSADASPDPLLLAPDPFSWAYRTFDTTQPGQLHPIKQPCQLPFPRDRASDGEPAAETSFYPSSYRPIRSAHHARPLAPARLASQAQFHWFLPIPQMA